MYIHIDGIDAVCAKLHSKASGMNEKLSKGIAQGCELVKGEAVARCPVLTGELQKSITSQVSGTTGAVGTNKEYAAYVEFGTYKMAAQPYLVPALKDKKGEVVEAIKAAIK